MAYLFFTCRKNCRNRQSTDAMLGDHSNRDPKFSSSFISHLIWKHILPKSLLHTTCYHLFLRIHLIWKMLYKVKFLNSINITSLHFHHSPRLGPKNCLKQLSHLKSNKAKQSFLPTQDRKRPVPAFILLAVGRISRNEWLYPPVVDS